MMSLLLATVSASAIVAGGPPPTPTEPSVVFKAHSEGSGSVVIPSVLLPAGGVFIVAMSVPKTSFTSVTVGGVDAVPISSVTASSANTNSAAWFFENSTTGAYDVAVLTSSSQDVTVAVYSVLEEPLYDVSGFTQGPVPVVGGGLIAATLSVNSATIFPTLSSGALVTDFNGDIRSSEFALHGHFNGTTELTATAAADSAQVYIVVEGVKTRLKSANSYCVIAPRKNQTDAVLRASNNYIILLPTV